MYANKFIFSNFQTFSIITASLIISSMHWTAGLWCRCWYNRHAKSRCSPSSREINSLLCVKPGIKPRFLSQKIAAKLPEKKIPSTAANAISRSANVAVLLAIQRNAQSAFFLINSNSKIALKSFVLNLHSCHFYRITLIFNFSPYYESIIHKSNLKKPVPFLWILNIGVNQHRIHLRMNVLNSNLKSIKTACLWYLNFLRKMFNLKAYS